MHDGKYFSTVIVKVRLRGSESCQIWSQARSIGSDRVYVCEWRFPYYESLGRSLGRKKPNFRFAPGAPSHDTELRLFDQSEM